MFTRALASLFNLYNLLILIRVFLSWIPSINWDSQPFRWISSVTDPVLNIFRGIFPPISGLDFSPVVAILALYIVEGFVVRMSAGLGL